MQIGVAEAETPDYVYIQPRDKHIVLNTAPLIETLRIRCLQHNEVSAVDLDNPEELDLFMNDLYNQLEYYTNVYTVEHLAKTVNGCLDRAEEYTRYKFTSMQRYFWMDVARSIVAQTFEYGLRDTRFISNYVYDRMMGLSLVLKSYDE